MNHNKYRLIFSLLLLTLILGACSPSLSSTPAATLIPMTPRPNATELILPVPKFISTVSTPHIDQPPNGNIPDVISTDSSCGYQWAYRGLPELSNEFQQAIRGLQASAVAFGEDCIYTDGHKTFTALETDFSITLQVNDLTNETDLGHWIVQVMQVILNIPKDKIAGPQPGRVSITFQAGDQNQRINFFIGQYQLLSPSLSKAEIYQALKTPQ